MCIYFGRLCRWPEGAHAYNCLFATLNKVTRKFSELMFTLVENEMAIQTEEEEEAEAERDEVATSRHNNNDRNIHRTMYNVLCVCLYDDFVDIGEADADAVVVTVTLKSAYFFLIQFCTEQFFT